MKSTGDIKQRLFYLHFQNARALAACYMPFIRNGGLYISTPENLPLGEQVFLLLRFLDESSRLAVSATVVWITPSKGVGVRLDDRESRARGRIENYLPEKKVQGTSLAM